MKWGKYHWEIKEDNGKPSEINFVVYVPEIVSTIPVWYWTR